MKKLIATHIKTVDPSPTDNMAAGFGLGQEWINTTTGIKYYHKTDGVWITADDSALVHKTGNETVAGTKTFTSPLVLGSTTFTENHAKESNMSTSTGLYSFASGGITMASSTTVNIGAVQGFIDDSSNPLATPIAVNYLGGTGITPTFLLTAPATYFLVKPDNTILQINARPTTAQRRDNIYLGVVGHPAGTITGIGNAPDIVMNEMSQVRAMFEPIRFINGGVFCYPQSVGTLNVANTAGVLYGLGIGFIANGNTAPTTLNIAAGVPTTLQYRTQGTATFSDRTTIDPLNYDVAGTQTVIPGSANQATNQRIFLLSNGMIRIQYGQTIYSTLSAAISAAQTESFVTNINATNLGILIGILSITKGCIDLTNTTTAQFLSVSKFGESVGAAAGISTANLQGTYTNSANPEIVTNSTLGALTLKRGSAADTDKIYEGQNGAGTTTWSVDGNGKETATSFVKSGAAATEALMGTGVTTILSSSTYAPTLTNILNTSLLAVNGTCSYIRVGNIVNVTVAFSVSITSTATFSKFSITLPINRATSSGTTIGSGSINHPGSDAFYTATATSASTTTVDISFYPPTGSGATLGNVSFQYDVTS